MANPIRRFLTIGGCSTTFLLLTLAPFALGQSIGLPNQTWSAEVIRTHGQPVIPLFDGWYPNEDGTSTICFGFFNMNTEQALDIPLGEHNYIETDYPGLDLSDALVPTHFDPLPPRYRHVFCAYSITVPEGFNTSHRINWHITANGQKLTTPGKVIASYVLDEPNSDGRGDIAPLVTLSDPGKSVRGRTGIHEQDVISARVNEPVILGAQIDHRDEVVWVGWAQHSGPGHSEFSNKEYEIESGSRTETEVRFSEPGEYVVRMQTIDDIAAFEFYCCHTNAYFHINVSN
ncbi:MAG: hypothetical protein MI746_02565 [Pseudomonadales bacterium]|nr:hypothetical protein [Pseudomonadales bacterium]